MDINSKSAAAPWRRAAIAAAISGAVAIGNTTAVLISVDLFPVANKAEEHMM